VAQSRSCETTQDPGELRLVQVAVAEQKCPIRQLAAADRPDLEQWNSDGHLGAATGMECCQLPAEWKPVP
ncbi:MAG: hypothetical protein AB7E69_16200, partial [Sphingomonadales bacterium]